MSRDISSYFLFQKSMSLLSERDIEVADEESHALYYFGVELTAIALAAAQLVEIVARTIFGLFIVPYYLFTQPNQARDYVEDVATRLLGLAFTTMALYHNLFSKTALIPSLLPLERFLEVNQVEMNTYLERLPKTFRDKFKTKEEAQYALLLFAYELGAYKVKDAPNSSAT